MKKCLYGLKQSPREWYRRLSTFLESCDFKATTFDPCVFVRRLSNANPGSALYISIYVDDIVMFGPQCRQADELVDVLKKEFEITDLGIASWLLGLQIKHDTHGIHLSQQSYIKRVLSRFGMASARPALTPMDPAWKPNSSSETLADPARSLGTDSLTIGRW